MRFCHFPHHFVTFFHHFLHDFLFAEEQRYYLVYQAAELNNRTQRLHKSLHFATSDGNPRDPKTWVRHGPVFDSYPFNTTETEYGAFLQDLGATVPPAAQQRHAGTGTNRRSLDEEPPPVRNLKSEDFSIEQR